MIVSFIIPAYNAAEYITRCLDSIFALKLPKEEFEVIVVDDCSTDETLKTIDDYRLKIGDCHFILLRQDVNQRQGAARNRGVSIAKGKYIVYIDSDDEASGGIVKAIELAEENHLDMVAFHSQKVDENGNIGEYAILPYADDDVFTGIQLQTEHPFWFTGPVAYVYQKAFIKKVNYPFEEGVLYEDSDYVNNHLYRAQRMGYVGECGYIIHYNSTSTTHSMSYKHVADYFLLGTRMLKLYDKIEDKSTIYADGIREGGSFNIWKAFRRLTKLCSMDDVRAFYNRIDANVCRADYIKYNEPTYCWTKWTKLGIMHEKVMIGLIGFIIVIKTIDKALKKILK